MKSPGITISSPKEYNFDWIDNPYVPCERLFPDIENVRELLNQMIIYAHWWDVFIYGNQVTTSLITPPCDFHILHEIYDVIDELRKDYWPEMDLIGYKVKQQTIHMIINNLKQYERTIVSHGGRPILEELKFRLGVL